MPDPNAQEAALNLDAYDGLDDIVEAAHESPDDDFSDEDMQRFSGMMFDRTGIMEGLSEDTNPLLVAGKFADESLKRTIGADVFADIRKKHPRLPLEMVQVDPVYANEPGQILIFRRLTAKEIGSIVASVERGAAKTRVVDADILTCRIAIVWPDWDRIKIVFGAMPMLPQPLADAIREFTRGGRFLRARVPVQ